MGNTCWDVMCGPDCAYCLYKQARYKQGFGTPCYEWFRARRIEKKCKECRFYLEQRQLNPGLPEDPAWHPGSPISK
jgi:hypothetical protein